MVELRRGLLRGWASLSVLWVAWLMILVGARLFEQLRWLDFYGLSLPKAEFAVPIGCKISAGRAVPDDHVIDLCWYGLTDFRDQFPVYESQTTYEVLTGLYRAGHVLGPRLQDFWQNAAQLLVWVLVPILFLGLVVWTVTWTTSAFRPVSERKTTNLAK